METSKKIIADKLEITEKNEKQENASLLKFEARVFFDGFVAKNVLDSCQKLCVLLFFLSLLSNFSISVQVYLGING